MTKTSKKRSNSPRKSSARIDPLFVSSSLEELFPDARCSLNFRNAFECLVAVSLSAQSTDEAVNKVTPTLFSKYPDPQAMAIAEQKDIEEIIHSLGLYRNKAKNLIGLSSAIVDRYGGEVPLVFEELTGLPGVGKKTAGVVLAEIAGRPAIPVDTHISRVAFRLGYVKEGEDPYKIEAVLESSFPKEIWIPLHHRMIAFGRKICHAKKPECDICPFKGNCVYKPKAKSTAGRKS